MADSPPSQRNEELLRALHFRVLLSRRYDLLPSEWSYSLRDPFWRIYVNEDSGATIVHQNKALILRPHVTYILPAWVRFKTLTRRRLAQNYIHFEVAGISQVLLQRLFPRPLSLPSIPWIRGIQDEWMRGQSMESRLGLAGFTLAGSFVHAVMALVFSRLTAQEESACFSWLEESGPLRTAIQYIQAHPERPPSNPELARLCGFSTSHFIRQFQLTVGMTPAQYGRESRVAIAARILHSQRDSIDEIASATGFSDRFHFSRVFQKQLGVSPAKYRQMSRRPDGNSTFIAGPSIATD